jgi:hypothetical protein
MILYTSYKALDIWRDVTVQKGGEGQIFLSADLLNPKNFPKLIQQMNVLFYNNPNASTLLFFGIRSVQKLLISTSVSVSMSVSMSTSVFLSISMSVSMPMSAPLVMFMFIFT